MGYDAFYYCNEIETVNIKDMTSWCLINFYEATSNPLYYASDLSLNGESVVAVNVSPEVTEISPYAFLGYEKLTSISFPDTITAIEDASFKGCTSLKVVELSKNTNSIGEEAFSGCSNLVKLVIPTTAKNIYFDTTAIPEWTTIYGIAGSAVETFANTNGYTFVPMGNSVFTIRYNANGGENAPANASKGIDMEYTISTAVPTKKHSTFVGWSTVKNGEVEYLAGDDYTDNASITLWAVWQEPQTIINDITVTPGGNFYVDIVAENCVPVKTITINNIEYSETLTLTSAEWLLTDSILSSVDINGDSVIAFESAIDANKAVMRLYFTADSELPDQDAYIRYKAKGTDEENVVFDFVVYDGTVKIRNFIVGDCDGDNAITIDDAIHLAFYTFYSDRYPIPNGMNVDFNKDGEVTIDDAIYLAFYTFYQDRYPLN